MSQPEPREIWFESYGPRIGWLGGYMPTTSKGLNIALGHIAFICVWIMPFALLGQLKILSASWVFSLVFPVLIATLVSLLRTASRHCAPFRWGGPNGSSNIEVD